MDTRDRTPKIMSKDAKGKQPPEAKEAYREMAREEEESKSKLDFGPLRMICDHIPQATAVYVDDMAVQRVVHVDMVVDANSEVFYATIKAQCASFDIQGHADIYNAFRKKSGEIVRVGKPKHREVRISTYPLWCGGAVKGVAHSRDEYAIASNVTVLDVDNDAAIGRVQRVTFMANVHKGVKIEIDVLSRSMYLGERLDIDSETAPVPRDLSTFVRHEIDSFVKYCATMPPENMLRQLAEGSNEPYEDLLDYAELVYANTTRYDPLVDVKDIDVSVGGVRTTPATNNPLRDVCSSPLRDVCSKIDDCIHSTGEMPSRTELENYAETSATPYEVLFSYAEHAYDAHITQRNGDMLNGVNVEHDKLLTRKKYVRSEIYNRLRSGQQISKADIAGYAEKMGVTLSDARALVHEVEIVVDNERVKVHHPTADKLILEIPITRGTNVKVAEDKIRRLVAEGFTCYDKMGKAWAAADATPDEPE